MWKVLVTKETIEELNLPTRPTKKLDKRAAWKGGDESVELDAVHPRILRQHIEQSIKNHIDSDKLDEWRRDQEDDEGIIDEIVDKTDN